MRRLSLSKPLQIGIASEGKPAEAIQNRLRGVENDGSKIVLSLAKLHEPSAEQHSTFDNRALNILISLNISYRARKRARSVRGNTWKNRELLSSRARAFIEVGFQQISREARSKRAACGDHAWLATHSPDVSSTSWPLLASY